MSASLRTILSIVASQISRMALTESWSLLAKLKRGLQRTDAGVIWLIVVVWVGIALIIQTLRVFTGTTGEPHAGDPCGPGHRYVWVNPANPDLSCEPE